MTEPENQSTSTRTVVILLFCLIGLIVLLVFLYKKLNQEANGEYTIQHLVYKEGGIRDVVRGAALTLWAHIRLQMRPERDADGCESQDEEMNLGGSQGSDSEGDYHEEEDNVEQCSKTEGSKDDTSDEDSSLEDAEAGEQTKLTDQPEQVEKGEEKLEKVEDREGRGEASRGAGLLIDLKHFSGSAIWSEEGVSEVSDVTPL